MVLVKLNDWILHEAVIHTSQLLALGDLCVWVLHVFSNWLIEVLRGTNKNGKWTILYTIAIAEMEKQNEKHLSSLFWMVHHFHVFSYFKNDCVPKQNKLQEQEKKKKMWSQIHRGHNSKRSMNHVHDSAKLYCVCVWFVCAVMRAKVLCTSTLWPSTARTIIIMPNLCLKPTATRRPCLREKVIWVVFCLLLLFVCHEGVGGRGLVCALFCGGGGGQLGGINKINLHQGFSDYKWVSHSNIKYSVWYGKCWLIRQCVQQIFLFLFSFSHLFVVSDVCKVLFCIT